MKVKLKQLKKIVIKIIKYCPLAACLVLTTAGFTIAGFIYYLVSKEPPEVTMDRPMFAAVLAPESAVEEAANMEVDFFEEDDNSDDGTQTKDDEKLNTEDESGNEMSAENSEDANSEVTDNTTDSEGYPTKFVKKKKEKSKYFSDPGKVALTTEYPYVKVGKEYFDDALFIGDSRVEGLKMYSGLDNATFYCKEGISMNKILTEKIVKMKIDGKKKDVSIARALKEKKFGKIYIMIGINEISYRENEDFKKKYSDMLEKIKALQPEAKIIVMGIMKVTNQYSSKNPEFSNGNINAKNVMIAELADGKNVFYMDFNPEICDSKGGVKKNYTWDGVHLKAEYYSIWVKFLKNHGF